MTKGASQRGSAVIFDLMAEFLESCRFRPSAGAIRSQLCEKEPPALDADFITCFRDFVDSASLLLSELESGTGEAPDKKVASGTDQEVLLEQLVEGLLQKLMTAGRSLSDEQLNSSIEGVLNSEGFAKLTSMGGLAKHATACAIPDISDLEFKNFWGSVTSGTTTHDPLVTGTVAASLDSHVGAGVVRMPDAQEPTAGVPPQQSEASAEPQPRVTSAHYIPRRPRSAREAERDWDEDDEYHDDDDPGYRIREIYEAELLAELSHKMATGCLPALVTDELVASTPAAEAAAAGAGTGASATLQSGEPVATENKRRGQVPRGAVKYAPSGDSFYPVELDGAVFDSFNLRVVFERDKTGFEESKEFVINMNAVVAARYQILEYLGSAAFSRAVQCLDLETNKMVCMKIIKNDKDFFDQSLDEIKLLKFINVNGNVDEHGVLRLYDYFYHKEHLIIVTELLRDNLYEFSKFNRETGDEPYFTLGRIQKITKQVLTALEYVHSLRLIHCDLKPENILIKSYSRCEVKVIDFGSSCFVDDHLSSYVQSRSYRAPEVMLGLPYDQKIDLWSLGCIVAELWTGYVLFQNDSVQSLLARILGIIGPFPGHLMMRGRHVPQYFTQDGQLYQEIDGPSCPERGRRLHLLVPKRTSLTQRMRSDCPEFLDFLERLLQLDPSRRPTSTEALQHPFLTRCKFPDGL
eukprot:CAMPEP_0179072092 /NCGR_PEP_ID=MMETSP0796-20121207/31875_1 /TAXON_ID=73915 /ORGANISM="Pyrodinium bahamense, Strain pbaha01" /LENGTH=691 /DNA_ID=CAMNT_0020769239 /DNA_START=83 /DNA_END=2158 /DNA_ORIENTATION=-